MRIDELLKRFDGVRASASGWVARCPAHGDRHQSLSVGEGEDGRILLHCFAGCTAETVVAALGLTMVDLMPEREPEGGSSRRTTTPTKPESCSTRCSGITRRRSSSGAPMDMAAGPGK